MAKYHRFSYTERQRVEQLKKNGYGVRQIARTLCRTPSTISRELYRRPEPYRTDFFHKDALFKQGLRQRQRKITGSLEAIIVYLLTELHCSPEQISGHLRLHYPLFPELQISPEAIYLWVYTHEKRKIFTSFLRKKRRYRRKRGQKRVRRGGIKNRTSIHQRPAVVDSREEVGHWEGDLIIGARNQSAIGTLVERSSRYTILVPLESKDSETVVSQFIQFLQKVPCRLRRSLTYDNGSEMAYHERLSQETGIQVFFTDPSSPWQRGSNENTNGLVREFFPKGTDLNVHSQERVGGVAALLNRRPRKVLGFNSSADVFDDLCINPESLLADCLLRLSSSVR